MADVDAWLSAGQPPKQDAAPPPAAVGSVDEWLADGRQDQPIGWGRWLAGEAAQLGLGGGGTVAGAAIGSIPPVAPFVGGPVGGGALGGMIGNYLGGMANRGIKGEDLAPLSGQAAVDAGVGAVAPMLPTAFAVGRNVVGRAVTGTGLPRAGTRALQTQELALENAGLVGGGINGRAIQEALDAGTRQATNLTAGETAAWQAYNQALNRAESMAAGAARPLYSVGPIAATIDVVGGLMGSHSLDPMRAAALLGVGFGWSQAQRKIAERMLMNPDTVARLQVRLGKIINPDKMTLSQVQQAAATELVAIAGEQGINFAAADAPPTNTLGGPNVGRQRRATPFDKILTPQGAPIGRDRRTGRFMAIGDEDNG